MSAPTPDEAIAAEVDMASIEVEMKLTTTEGVIVPIKAVIEYPNGYGFYAVKAVETLTERGELYAQMINRRDFSTLRVMAAHSDGDRHE